MALAATDLTVIDGEARIADSHLQAVLGYARINDLHRIIRKHEDELGDHGGILCRTGKVFGRGQPPKTFLLTEGQATLVCMFARTPKARAARKLIVEVFTAWRRGQLPPPPAAADPFAALRAQVEDVAAQLRALREIAGQTEGLTHLPIWTGGQRPWWWENLPLRAFLTASHRQMTLKAASARALKEYGAHISVSGLQRYWARLDGCFGPQGRRPRKARRKFAVIEGGLS